jgi:hypothetical protein
MIRTGGASRSCPSHTTGHAGPHLAVRLRGGFPILAIHIRRRSMGTTRRAPIHLNAGRAQ